MSDPRPDDLDLIAQFKAGNEAAATELFDRYCEQLMRLARRRIGPRMTSRVDPEDILQSAFRTFFARVRNEEFSFQQEDDLFKLLVRLTVRKTLRQIAFHRAGKRNPERETAQPTTDHDILLQVSAHGPTPEVELALVDEFEQFMGQLPPLDRDVLALKLQGYSTVEIADKLGSYDRKIRRILDRIQDEARAQDGQASA
jgi:RNA polymerase sigma-70 factor (ECF subfamily)